MINKMHSSFPSTVDKILLLWVFGIFLAPLHVEATVSAQVVEAIKSTNPLKIDDECYKLYIQARNYRNNPKCLEYSRAMLQLAEKKHDHKGICHALIIPPLYYRHNGSEKQFFASLDTLRNRALKYDMEHYYYWCFNEEIGYLIDTQRTFKALNRVNDLIKNAKNITPEFSFACYKAFGDVYVARRDEVHARESYNKAIEISDKLGNKKDVSPTYLSLARIADINDTIGRINTLHRALETSVNLTDSASALMGLAYCYSNYSMKKEFMEVYREYTKMLPREGLAAIRNDKWYRSNEAYRMDIEHKFDSADIMRQSIQDPYMRYQAESDYYVSTHDYKQATVYYDSLVTLLRSAQSVQNITDVAELNARYETEKLRHEANDIRQYMTNVVSISTLAFFVIIIIILVVVNVKTRKTTKHLQALTSELQQMRDHAVNASKMKDIFIQNMSHEIRTPLNAVSGFAQLLALPAEFFSDEERAEFGKHIQNNTNLLTMLIDDILSISDVESGNYNMVIDTYKINEVVDTAITTVKLRVKEGIELRFNSEVDKDYTIQTDARRVQQVLVNFLTNAIKHTEAGHIQVDVSLKEVPGNISFIVSDTGTGVPKEKAEAIFQRFEKLNVFKQGTGLGLNICRIISENLHGRCYLDTNYPEKYPEIEHGARFVFTIPIER